MATPFAAASTFEAMLPASRSLTSLPVGADEALARGPDEDREAERDNLLETIEDDEIVVDVLAEADARVEHDAMVGDAGAARDGDRTVEVALDGIEERHLLGGVRLPMTGDHGRPWSLATRAMSGSRWRP